MKKQVSQPKKGEPASGADRAKSTPMPKYEYQKGYSTGSTPKQGQAAGYGPIPGLQNLQLGR